MTLSNFSILIYGQQILTVINNTFVVLSFRLPKPGFPFGLDLSVVKHTKQGKKLFKKPPETAVINQKISVLTKH